MTDGGNGSGNMLARVLGSALSPANSRGRLVVFCYHQVLAEPDPFRPGEPDESQFREDLRLITRLFNVLEFGEAAARLASGSLPRRAACITFDDGYADNFEVAAPVLTEMGVPATIFVAGGAVDVGVMWNDLVIEAVGNGAPAEKAQQIPGLLARLKYLPPAERWDKAVRMYRDSVSDELPRLMMTRDMVADLASRGFEIGGHTINHPILSALPDDEAQAEIKGCSQWIRDVTGSVPQVFAYPNGIPGRDYASRHEEMVRAAGFRAAASTEWAVAGPGSSPYAIPRVGPWWRQGRSLLAGLVRGYAKSYLR